MAENRKVQVMNISYSNLDHGELLEAAVSRAADRRQAMIVFLNTDVVVKADRDSSLARIIRESEYVMADGMPLIWISRLLRRPLKEKVSGSDFVPLLCERAAGEGYSVFFVGGKPEVLDLAMKRLTVRYPKIRIAGFDSPPVGFEKDPAEIRRLNEKIRKAGPDILIVCLGCPKQERYLYENRRYLEVPLCVCAGATIDFLSGTIKRAPAWMSRHGLEWFYRFLQEPGRLFKRYFIDDMQVIGLMARYWYQRKEKS